MFTEYSTGQHYHTFIDRDITAQSLKKWSNRDRNNVRFLPGTATHVLWYGYGYTVHTTSTELMFLYMFVHIHMFTEYSTGQHYHTFIDRVITVQSLKKWSNSIG